MQELELVLKIHPNFIEALDLRAVYLIRGEKYLLAVKDFKHILKLNPNQ
jgi:lipoprotein NlpI